MEYALPVTEHSDRAVKDARFLRQEAGPTLRLRAIDNYTIQYPSLQFPLGYEELIARELLDALFVRFIDMLTPGRTTADTART